MHTIFILTCFILNLSLNANPIEGIKDLSYFVTAGEIEKIQEATIYSEVETSQMAIVDSTAHIEEIKEEIGELLEQNALKKQVEISLDTTIEKETAKVLQDHHIEDEKIESIEPSIEDLSHLAEGSPPAVEESLQAEAIEEKEVNVYETLFISIEDKQNINSLLMTLADNGVFKLLFEKKRLERLGHKISHVHPMRFLGTVFSDPRLVGCMYRIRRSGFKWDGFIEGFSERFKKEIKANNINKYVPGFADMLGGIKAADIQAYVNYKDFEGLVLFLMEKKRN